MPPLPSSLSPPLLLSLFRCFSRWRPRSMYLRIFVKKRLLCRLINDPGLADRTNLTPAQIADLLNFVLRSTYFQYNGSIYEQKDGAAMGSPVSAVIANIFLEDFEEHAIASAIYKPKIWKRYVDDTFTILDRDQVDGFLQHLNNQQTTIRFT